MGYFAQFNKGEGIPFMEGRTKVDTVCDVEMHLVDYAFLSGDNGDYAVMLFAEYPQNFMFGNKIITSDLKQIESDLGKEQALKALASVGIKFTRNTSKRGREYVGVEFIEHTENDGMPF